MEALEVRTMAKVSRRLIPFVIICYFVAFLDRVNLGFAALEMNKDLGFSATVYGLGAGMFFISYFSLETPSNLILVRTGARIWIARIMFTWGILSGAMAFVQGETSFYIVRFLLGAAEAGFFPGILFYLTLFFPAAYRGRMVAMFMVAIPFSAVIGSPLSSAILYADGFLGLRGWQWVFISEAVPAVILSGVRAVVSDRHVPPRRIGSRPMNAIGWCSARLRSDGSARRYTTSRYGRCCAIRVC